MTPMKLSFTSNVRTALSRGRVCLSCSGFLPSIILQPPPYARAEGDEKLVQLLERVAGPTCTPGSNRPVESFVRGIKAETVDAIRAVRSTV